MTSSNDVECVVMATIAEWLDPTYTQLDDGTQVRVSIAWDLGDESPRKSGQYVPLRVQEKVDGDYDEGRLFRVRVTAEEISDDR